MNTTPNIIFFDGHCGLCDRFVTKIFMLDKKRRFRFASLQGPTASRILLGHQTFDSVIYLKDEKMYDKSQAVLEILTDIGGFCSVFRIFKIIPSSLSDRVYDFVAQNRYGWFGKSLTCRLPSNFEKNYFLD